MNLQPGHHHGTTDDAAPPEIQFTQEWWDDRYRSADQLWSGQPNPQLVVQAGGLVPGDALDVGCGEGADAIWLARRGWIVTAIDISAVALERAAAHARASGREVASRVRWQREDLLTCAPAADDFDLVSAQFMHVPEPELSALHRRLAAAVRTGGTLLLVLHHPEDIHANVGRPDLPGMFPRVEDLAARLDPGQWDVVVADVVARAVTDLDGQPATVKDAVLRAVRLP